MRSNLSLLLCLATTAFGAPLEKRAGRTEAPAGCLVAGGSGKYSTVQSAVNALSKTTTSSQCIFINPGTYKEQVVLSGFQSPIVLYGSTTDTSSYTGNQVTITQSKSQADGIGNDATATLRATTPNLKVYNINFVNSYGKGSQAVAVSATNDKQGYYGVSMKGFQDTLLANQGNQVYAKCFIEGATDFIFGQQATAWFDSVTLNVVSTNIGYITANGRDSESNPSYYVINKSTVTGTSGAGTYYLGRPWRNYSRVVFQNSVLSNVINAAGWTVWGSSTPRTDHVSYGEFGNTGDGAKGTRANFSKKLSAAVSITEVLGASYRDWVDTSYLS